ncbi:MAG: SBBP repeat-containing protein [Acidobacteriota bacterium]
MPWAVWCAGVIPQASPKWFEPNQGQFAGDSLFVARTSEATVEVLSGGLRYRKGGQRLDMHWLGSPGAMAVGLDALGSKSQYLRGDRSHWKPNVPHFARVRSQAVYPGIDAVYYWKDGRFEFDFLVAPHADAKQVRLKLDGAREVRLENGELVAQMAEGKIALKRPVAYQMAGVVRTPVSARYELRGGEVRLALGKYDRTRELIVDPVVFGGYFGGDVLDGATATAVDGRGNVWVAGYAKTSIAVTPPLTPIQDLSNGGRDGFLAKFEPQADGTMKLAYYSFFGGTGNDDVAKMVVRDDGFVYLAGTTDSIDYPTAGIELPKIAIDDATVFSSGIDAFITVLRPEDANGEYVWYSQTYGGLGKDVASALAVDRDRNVYIGGYTTSDKLPGIAAESSSNLQGSVRGGWEGWLIKVTTTASSPLQYATFLGGNSTDIITSMAIAPDQTLYLTGYTASTDFPVTVDQSGKPDYTIDLFLAQVDTTRSGLDVLRFARLAGGSALDIPQAIAVDGQNSVWLAGYTTSSDFPVTAASYRREFAGETDAFLLHFDLSKPLSEQITYGTYLGAGNTDLAYDLALMPNGRVALTGYTLSSDFPFLDSSTTGTGQAVNAFVTVLDTTRADDAALVLSRPVGGSSIDIANSIAIAPDGGIYIGGLSSSPDLAVTDGSTKVSARGSEQSFLFKVMTPAPPSN